MKVGIFGLRGSLNSQLKNCGKGAKMHQKKGGKKKVKSYFTSCCCIPLEQAQFNLEE